jgi:hypothetical protein
MGRKARFINIGLLLAVLVLFGSIWVEWRLAAPGPKEQLVRRITDFAVTTRIEPAVRELVENHGQVHYTENAEELIIRDFFQDRRDGFFVDIGANHYKIASTTYYLERHLGWRGIAVDALDEFGDD